MCDESDGEESDVPTVVRPVSQCTPSDSKRRRLVCKVVGMHCLAAP